jgi:hypothetical protein
VAHLLLLVLALAAVQVRAQNQTPANVGPPPPVGWTDPATGLTWTTEDNGSPVNWNQATAYCSNLRLGGYSDWRLPTIDELQGIYDPGSRVPGSWRNGEANWRVKGNLKLSGVPWSSTQKNAEEAWRFNFSDGERYSMNISNAGSSKRALCVRR